MGQAGARPGQVHQYDSHRNQHRRRDERRRDPLRKKDHPEQHAEQRGEEAEHRQPCGEVLGQQPEPGEIARKCDDDALAGKDGDRERRHARHTRFAHRRRDDRLRDRRDGELVEERFGRWQESPSRSNGAIARSRAQMSSRAVAISI